MKHYSIGIDFGTEEARAMLVDMDGNCGGSAVFCIPMASWRNACPTGQS